MLDRCTRQIDQVGRDQRQDARGEEADEAGNQRRRDRNILHDAVGAISGAGAARGERARRGAGSDVADATECATEALKTRAPPDAVCDHRCGTGHAQISPKSETRRRGYFTTRSSGRRGWSCVCLEGGCGSLVAVRSISSHSALRSALSIPLSFIRTSRMTMDSSSADSRLLLSLSTLRHSSSVSSTDCNCSSECDTGVLPANSACETWL